MKLTASAALTVMLALTPHAQAQPAVHPDKTLSPYFVVPGSDGDAPPLLLQGTEVDIQVAGVIANVKVLQVYHNQSDHPINPTYVFPASTRAAVHGLTMRIGSKQIRAQIKERQAARREFERAEAAGKTATLLEQERANVFRMSLANVMPGDRIEVELEYSELLVPNERVYELVYPTVVGPRYSEQRTGSAPASDRWIASPYTPQGTPPMYTLTLRATLKAGLPVTELSSPSHEVSARWASESEVVVNLDPKEKHGGNRDFVLRYRLAGEEIQSGLVLHQGEESFFLLTVQPPKRVEPAYIPPREYVFVVDVSGSMHGFPLDTTKHLLRQLLADLRPVDTFNMVFFSGGSASLAPRSLPAVPVNVNKAIAMLNGQTGGGGTRLLAALRHAMSLPHEQGVSRNFVVITDGYISAEKATFAYIRANLGQANVFAFGVGTSVNRRLIEGIATAGLGEPFVVLDPSESSRVARQFREYIRAPVLTDVRVSFDGFDAYEVEPGGLPDVLADRPLVLQGKWRGKPKGRVVVRGHSGKGPFEQVFNVAETYARDGVMIGGPLGTLWARARVATLADFGAVSAQEREQIVALGLKYNLLTDYTSFVAVHEEVRNTQGKARDVVQPLPLPQGVSNLAVGGMAQGPEPGLWMILFTLLAALGGRVLRHRREVA